MRWFHSMVFIYFGFATLGTAIQANATGNEFDPTQRYYPCVLGPDFNRDGSIDYFSSDFLTRLTLAECEGFGGAVFGGLPAVSSLLAPSGSEGYTHTYSLPEAPTLARCYRWFWRTGVALHPSDT